LKNENLKKLLGKNFEGSTFSIKTPQPKREGGNHKRYILAYAGAALP